MSEGPLEKAPGRDAVAQGLRTARMAERNPAHSYELMRTGNKYAEYLGGKGALSRIFDHVRTLPTRTVLDVGAGATIGTKGLSEMDISHDLSFKATVLSKSEARRKIKAGILSPKETTGSVADIIRSELGLGDEQTKITSVEILRGIEHGSVGAVTTVYGMAYSAAPSMAIDSIDRVLTKGGVFQGYFPDPDQAEVSMFHVHSHKPFMKRFEELGYTTNAIHINHGFIVLTAVKPGRDNAPSAKSFSEPDKSRTE